MRDTSATGRGPKIVGMDLAKCTTDTQDDSIDTGARHTPSTSNNSFCKK